MRVHRNTVAAAVLFICACSSPTSRSESAELREETARTKLYQLSWLAGDWRMERADGYTEECWLPAQGGVMLGLGFSVDAEKMKSFEYLRIETRGDSLVYVASPNGEGPSIEFSLTDLTLTGVLFENPDHSFPNWICYQLVSPESVVATIGGETGTIEFCYVRKD
jgi:hypothetical protein